MIERPNCVDDEHFEYLDNLRESGETNMFGAAPYLQREFPEVGRNNSHTIVQCWMASFSERHPQ